MSAQIFVSEHFCDLFSLKSNRAESSGGAVLCHVGVHRRKRNKQSDCHHDYFCVLTCMKAVIDV